MKTIKTAGVFLTFILSIGMVHAQDGTGYESSGYLQAPPSPTAAALGKFGEFSVGGSSGTPGIGVPLFEVKGTQMSIPISLSYAGSGIAVNDIASWVGLGWSLNAGGVITRTIKGNPDEASGIHSLYNSNGFDPDTFYPRDPVTGFFTNLAVSLASGAIKGQPDVYSFNFLGYSGQFYIDHTGGIHQYEHTDLTIERTITNPPSGHVLYSFTVKTGDGTTATFTEAEVTHLDTGDGNSYRAETAWYLSSITRGNDTFTFTYADESISYGYQYSEVEFKFYTSVPCVSQGVQDTYGATLSIDKKRLTSIVGPFDTATFTENPGLRPDLLGGRRLASISYQDQIATFNTSYDLGVVQNAFNGVRDRLFLNSVSILAGGDIKNFSFDYNPTDLPPTNAYSQDFWGYYNGASLNTTLLPTYYAFFTGGADREANPAYMEAGMLTKITFPTGGYTLFDWEPNSGLVDVYEKQCTGEYGFYEATASTTWTDSRNVTFVADGGTLDITYDVGVGTNPEQETGVMKVVVTDPVSATIYEEDVSGTGSIEIPANTGQYNVAFSNNTGVPITYADADVDRCDDVLVTKTQYFGGLRTASISSHDKDGTLATSKNYTYGPMTTARTVDNWMYVDAFEVDCPDAQGPRSYHVIRRASNNLHGMSPTISYDWIKETYADNSSKESHFFVYTGDNGRGIYVPQDGSWKRGKVDEVFYNDDLGNPVKKEAYNYTMVQQDEYKGIVITNKVASSGSGLNGWMVIEEEIIYWGSDWARLDNVVTTEYFPGGNLVTTQNFEYFRSDEHVQAGSVETTLPDGSKRKQIALYPRDIGTSSAIWDQLKAEHYLKPIEIISYDPIEDVLLSGQRMEYNFKGNMTDQWTLDTGDELAYTGFTHANGNTDPAVAIPGNYFENTSYGTPEVSLLYDDELTVEVAPRSGVAITYLWGYGGKYPVAEFTNIGYNELVGLVTVASVNALKAETVNTEVLSKLNAFVSSLPSDVSYKFFIYEEGIGPVEMTDTNGEKMKYTYDDFGRLVIIKDDNDKVLKQIEYGYGN